MAECCYAECRYGECHLLALSAECRYAECRYTECRGANLTPSPTKHETVCNEIEIAFKSCVIIRLSKL